MLTIDGLISGLDTESIIAGLLEIQQSQIDRLNARKTDIEARRAAFGSLEVQLVSFKGTVDRLARIPDNLFLRRTATPSDENALLVTANTRAATGSYQLRIDALAQAHQVATNGFSAADAEITQGTLDIQVGSAAAVTVTIDSSNNTLEGLAQAINDSDAAVSAAIVNDGSGPTPFRLLLTSRETGVANALTLTNNLAPTGGSATLPVFDTGNPVQAAVDSQVRLGSGTGALVVSHSTNRLETLIEGVTLNLLAADPTKTLTVKIEQNATPAMDAVNELVDGYNSIMSFIDELVKYDPETEQAGLLIGDRAITDIQNELRTAIQDIVPGLDSSANRLSVLGITTNDRGQLTVNQTRLEEVLSGRVAGIEPEDLKALFSLDTDQPTSLPAGFPGSVTSAQGVGVRLAHLLNEFVDVQDGDIAVAKRSLVDRLATLDASLTRQQESFQRQQDDLVAQFVALESAIGEIQNTSSFLASQLGVLSQLRTGRS